MIKKDKKGFSLIEILVSLAIASIIVLSITQLIINMVKFNKKSEDRQQTTLVGQQIVEEIKNLDSSNISSSLIKISDDLILNRVENSNEYKGILTDRNNLSKTYDVALTLNYENQGMNKNNEKVNIENAIKFKSEVINEVLIIKDENNNEVAKLSLNTNETPKLIIERRTELNNKGKIDNTLSINLEDEVFIDFSNYNFNGNLDVYIYNYIESEFTVYAQKPDNPNIKLKSILGIVSIHNNPIYDSIGYLYNITVSIKKNGKLLFEGYINKNISNQI
ncbi:type IV pilus modification PilV family protein [Romboutsia sp. 1001713B170207_170306_H8]|uniref:type IV pilus modification PilV family protein n=1 Tax=Romboutsia sp. 1001713B170207_170306_H8 TaxID=2787112 RepID=UPI0008208AC7|nr:prepilin-type N-terminal cleavage/methylation domain-containing protein [Romboutsia sp. 1001713B170207_170306_H8]SCI38426.1 Tfp pilus assembly protein PilV [uncultured Clostridium sp.]